jgi:hypothetical protein
MKGAAADSEGGHRIEGGEGKGVALFLQPYFVPMMAARFANALSLRRGMRISIRGGDSRQL